MGVSGAVREAAAVVKRSVTSYTIAESCVWPERRGLTAYAVTPSARDLKRYPFHGLGRDEVVIWIDDDPLTTDADVYPDWTCVIARSSLLAVAS